MRKKSSSSRMYELGTEICSDKRVLGLKAWRSGMAFAVGSIVCEIECGACNARADKSTKDSCAEQ